MQKDLLYTVINAGGLGSTYFNLTRDLSMMNSKNHEHTDRDGHVKGYIINFEMTGADGQNVLLNTAPNTWKFRNSFRKFHAYRELMFKNAGVSKSERGKYGHTIRPYMDKCHFADETAEGSPDIAKLGHWSCSTPSAFTGGEWTYSELATVPLYTEQAGPVPLTTLSFADEWPLMICGVNQPGIIEAKTSGTYDIVAMINSYNIDRMSEVTPSSAPGVTLSGPINPLAALIASGNQAAGEILEIVQDLELENPPYDIADDGDSVNSVTGKMLKIPTTGGVARGSMFVPAGLLQVYQTLASDIVVKSEIVAEVLCKDMA